MQKAICGWTAHIFPKHLFFGAIQLFTLSKFSHVELLIDDHCYSSSLEDGGVRKKKIDLNKPWWTVIPAPWLDEERVLKFYETTKGNPYGWKDLIFHHILSFPTGKDYPGYFCSEWCAGAIGMSRAYAKTPKNFINFALKRS